GQFSPLEIFPPLAVRILKRHAAETFAANQDCFPDGRQRWFSFFSGAADEPNQGYKIGQVVLVQVIRRPLRERLRFEFWVGVSGKKDERDIRELFPGDRQSVHRVEPRQTRIGNDDIEGAASESGLEGIFGYHPLYRDGCSRCL